MEKLVTDEKEIELDSADSFITKLYKKIYLHALSKMRNGHVRVIENGNESYHLGDPNSNFKNYNNGLMQINRPSQFYKKAVLFGDIGFSESYVDGDWDTDDITNILSWFLINVEDSPSLSGAKKFKPHIRLFNLINRFYHLRRPNTIKGSRKNIVEHYDLGNQFYKLFLDQTMTYSSAYFHKDDISLEEAQLEKYSALASHLNLQPHHHVLEIGSGWGGFSLYLAKKFGCKITTVTISDEQFKYAKELFQKEGVDHLVDIQLMDYRLIRGKFDRIVSIEMLEAVGEKYLDTYFKKCNELLTPEGVLALQVITCPDSRYEEFKNGVDFIQKHIFPGSLLPSIGRINQAINRTGNMHLLNLLDMGKSYAKTLQLWLKTFDQNLSAIRSLGYDERFVRLWRYYLSYCEAAFKMRNISVVQLTYTKPNNLSLD
ncbi:MAG: class I SAM-dependent methyltransferase [Leptospiraceae bacterium]|nr:class I SAM-dependent methyltransferase [Leptospiraceae bacterium]MCP5510951.1 class I SAM-dependent methyltransferase [Leptospiraceae bacterium]